MEGLSLFGEMTGINALASLTGAVQMFPLSQSGFGWIIPAIVGSIIFTLISKFTKKGGIGENYKVL